MRLRTRLRRLNPWHRHVARKMAEQPGDHMAVYICARCGVCVTVPAIRIRGGWSYTLPDGWRYES